MKLTDKARELRNAYQRAYRRKNPDKLRQYNLRYWEKKASEFSIVDQVKDFHLQGFTQREIAEQLNIAVGTVNKYLNKE